MVEPRLMGYYAVTKQVMDVNYEFFSILDSRSLPRMTSFWLNSDYVKCFNGTGELFSGYFTYLRLITIIFMLPLSFFFLEMWLLPMFF